MTIKNVGTGKVLDVYMARTSDDTDVIAWTNHKGRNQLWQYSLSGYLINVNSNKYLTTLDGKTLVQYEFPKGLGQTFILVPTGDAGTYKIQFAFMDKYVTATNVNSSRANVTIEPSRDDDSQKWTIEYVKLDGVKLKHPHLEYKAKVREEQLRRDEAAKRAETEAAKPKRTVSLKRMGCVKSSSGLSMPFKESLSQAFEYVQRGPDNSKLFDGRTPDKHVAGKTKFEDRNSDGSAIPLGLGNFDSFNVRVNAYDYSGGDKGIGKDDVYIERDEVHAWPEDSDECEMSAGDIVDLNLEFFVDRTTTLEIRDHDQGALFGLFGSSSDLLGKLVFRPTDPTGKDIYFAYNADEGSVYLLEIEISEA